MRISTNQIFQNGTNGILNQQSLVYQTQQQLSTGKQVNTPSDNPIGAAQIVQLQQSIDGTNTYQSNITYAQSTLGSESNALTSVTDIMQRIRELAVQANSSVLTAQDRQSIATEIHQDLASLVGVANSQDGSGNYLFSGNMTKIQPFSAKASGYSYAGDQGQRVIQIGSNRQVAAGDSGYAVFQAIKNGNGTFTTAYGGANTGTGTIDAGQITNQTAWVPDTYTITFTTPTTYQVQNSSASVVASGTYQSGAAIAFNGAQVMVTGSPAAGDTFTVAPSTNQDIFTTVQNLVNTLNNGDGTPTAQANFGTDIGNALTNIDQAMANIGSVVSGVGARLSALDSQQTYNSGFILASQTALSAVQDLNYTQAASLLTQQSLSLQAAQQSFVKIQNLSLFNYIQ